ncbi:MAG: tRNA guanosine(34) transglycosylase Tgt [bacterium]|nr:tRNA guanosine(34) transglycosylase Tgt [bacterium]
MFEFKILSKNKNARTGTFKTPHGDLHTPELAIVATDAQVRGVSKVHMPNLPMKFTISNTFHTFTKGLIPEIEKAKGINNYMNYKGVTATDSGGFQVFSLGFGKAQGVGKVANIFPGENQKEKGLLVVKDQDNLLHITDNGVMFNYDNKFILFTPELSINIQERLGADIIFSFDECTSPLNSHEYTLKAMERTHDWFLRGLRAKTRTDQGLFAVTQGGAFKDLRIKSAQFLGKQQVAGFGIGGSLGRSKEDMWQVVDWTIPNLPDNKPKHLLGIGQIRDIFEAVERGIDLFDCVIPTREARHKVLYTKHGKKLLRKMRKLDEVIEKNCQCLACSNNVTMKQLYQYFLLKDERAFLYSTAHNIQFYSNLMKEIRESIHTQSLDKLKQEYWTFY